MSSKDPQYMRDFKEYTRGNPTIDDVGKLEAELYGGSARATAVLYGSFVETSLRRYLETRLISSLNSDDRKSLFDYRGPLGSFSGMIIIAYAIGALGPVVRDDLNLLRENRNGAAHSRMHFSFEAPAVAGMCAHLQTPDFPDAALPFTYLDKLPDDEMAIANDITHPRTRFLITTHTLAHRMLTVRQDLFFQAYISTNGPALLP